MNTMVRDWYGTNNAPGYVLKCDTPKKEVGEYFIVQFIF